MEDFSASERVLTREGQIRFSLKRGSAGFTVEGCGSGLRGGQDKPELDQAPCNQED
jgi:hypothetical protein